MQGPYRIIRNAPYMVQFWNVNGSGVVVTGETLAGVISKDNGAFGATSATPTETPATSALFKFELTATEMTADLVALKITGAALGTYTLPLIVPEPAIDSGVAQAGASGTITLRSGASATDDLYNGYLVEIVRGTGLGQLPRLVVDYVGSTKVATVLPAWGTNPDNTSVYKIIEPPPGLRNVADFWSAQVIRGTAASGTAGLTLKTTLTGYGTSAFRDAVVMAFLPTATTNRGLMRAISAYDSTTGDITLTRAFPTDLSEGDTFWIMGFVG